MSGSPSARIARLDQAFWTHGASGVTTSRCDNFVGNASNRCKDDVLLQRRAAHDAALKQYMQSVYRDESVVRFSSTRLADSLADFSWFYHSAKEVRPTTCVLGHDMWRRPLCNLTRNGSTVGLLFRTTSLIHRMNDWGFWAPPAGRCDGNLPRFLDDNVWAEVFRVAPLWTFGEGGAFGCWFFGGVGSGVYLNTGKSLRVANRSALADALGLNVTAIFRRPVHGVEHLWTHLRLSNGSVKPTLPHEYDGVAVDDEVALRRRYFDNNPWRLEAKINPCEHARKLGFTTIQLWDELCSINTARAACQLELISCDESCMKLPNKKARAACIPGMELRTGWNASLTCVCKQSLPFLNCLGTSPHIDPPTGHYPPRRLPSVYFDTWGAASWLRRLPSCWSACSASKLEWLINMKRCEGPACNRQPASVSPMAKAQNRRLVGPPC